MRRTTATWVLLGLAAIGSALVTPPEILLAPILEPVVSAPSSPPPIRDVRPIATVTPPIYAPELSAPPTRLDVPPLNRWMVPIGGRNLLVIRHAMRHGRCAEALDHLQTAAHEVSVDYIALARPVWRCFDRHVASHAEHHRARSAPEMGPVFAWLGSPPIDEDHAVPFWYRPASSGIEMRLERYTADALLREALTASMGSARLADGFARDVQLEWLAARALAQLSAEDRTPDLVAQWARRVFYVTWALGQAPGELLATHRPDVSRGLREALSAMLEAPDVPSVVHEAHDVARGGKPAPR
ncbi:MAG: hypothetical protein AAGA48_27405 [Myxococcota bacterium]